MDKVISIVGVHNELEVLALQLGVETSAIEFLNEHNQIHRFKHEGKAYVVAHDSVSIPCNVVTQYNGHRWSISSKHLVKIIGIRTPVAEKNGWHSLSGQIGELTGNAYYGFKIVLADRTKYDWIHFNVEYINR